MIHLTSTSQRCLNPIHQLKGPTAFAALVPPKAGLQ
jgi:hypothetical protein